jgi:signal transduction histidine kinase
LNLAQKIKAKSKEVEGYRLLSELHEARRDFEKALEFYETHTESERELLNVEKSRQLAEMRVRYEAERKEREAELYHLRNVELRKEVRERRRAEMRLQEHRDQLEGMVAERTAKLEATNVELRGEIAARKQVEEELLGYQRQLRSLAHELSLVEERQRRRIATVLHDNISQSLMIVKSGLDVLVSATLDKKVLSKLREIQAQVRQMIERTRSMTFEISPPVLYELGLEPAMEWLVERFQEQHGIACEFYDDGRAKPVSEDWRSILFQSTRELLANVRKHAKAEKVLVSVCRDGRHVRITVEDDGAGFDPEILGQKIAKNEGFGLFNLQQRLTHLRGKVVIDSERGRGAKVTLLAPLKREKKIRSRM